MKLAPRDPALEAWKRSAAERIHLTNQKSLFEGRPHHLLQAVIVVEAAVDKSGNVVASKVTRSPHIKRLDDMALASLESRVAVAGAASGPARARKPCIFRDLAGPERQYFPG